jgi:heat shock protein HslJ
MLRSILALSLFALAAACVQTPEAGTAPPLVDTVWRLARVDGKEIPARTQGRPEPAHLRLTGEGRVEGSGGCNRFFGEYRQAGERLEFAPLAATRRACFSGMVEEDAFLKALGEVRSWKRQGGLLRLYDAAGRLLLELEASQGQESGIR